MTKWLLLMVSHGAFLVLGVMVGIYALPILIAPAAPSSAEVNSKMQNSIFRAEVRRDLRGSDAFHWGEGEVSIQPDSIAFHGELAPGPDYKLYLAPQYVEDEESFLQIKPESLQVGEVKTFKNFLIPLNNDANPESFNTVVVWCESFSEFITAAKYR